MNQPAAAHSKQADVPNAEKCLEEKKDTTNKPSSRGHKRQQASLGLGIITTNLDLSQSTAKASDQTEQEEEDRSKTDAFFSDTLPTPRPPPSLSRRADIPPSQTSPPPTLPPPTATAIEEAEAEDALVTPRLSFASRLRNLVAANKGTTVAPAPSAIPNNYTHRSGADVAQKLNAPAATNNHLSYSDDEIMPLPSPAPALSSPSNSTTSTKPSFPKHRIVSPPQLSPVTPDKEAPSPTASTSIPVIALSPSFSPEKKNKIPSLSEEPMLGDMEDVTYNGKSSSTGGGLVVPMMREYKFPSPTPQQYSDEDIIGKQIGDYRIKKLLGVGAFSKVYLAQRTDHDSAQYAIKMVNKQRISKDPRVRSSIEREVGVLKFIDHPSIVRLDATMETEQHLCIVMEYAKGQELFDFVQQMHRKIRTDPAAPLDELLIKRIFMQLVRVVKWMHDHNVVHRDLKLENILIHMEDDGTPRVKVTDFGLARVVDPEAPILTTRCGSEEYAAPEIVQGLGYDGRQTDTWALGVILYSLLAGYLPFMYNPSRGEKVSHLFYRIVSADYRWPSDWQQHPKHAASAEAKQVVERILVRQPEKRISLNDIENLPWFVS